MLLDPLKGIFGNVIIHKGKLLTCDVGTQLTQMNHKKGRPLKKKRNNQGKFNMLNYV